MHTAPPWLPVLRANVTYIFWFTVNFVVYWVACPVLSLIVLAIIALVIYCVPSGVGVGVGVGAIGEGMTVTDGVRVVFVCVVWTDLVFVDKSG